MARVHEHAGLVIVSHDPLESSLLAVAHVQRTERAIRTVEIADPARDAGVRGVRADRPVELVVVVPLAPHTELAAHEQELLAGQRPLIAVEQAQRCIALPRIRRHLRDQRSLAVHDLVVGQRQHVVLGVRVDRTERELIVVVLAVHRIALEEIERVVHPAQVPLVAKAEAAVLRRA